VVEKLRSCEGLNDERSLSVIRGGRRRIRFNDRRHWITPAGRLQMLQSLLLLLPLRLLLAFESASCFAHPSPLIRRRGIFNAK